MYSQRIKLDILNHNGPDLFARVGEGSVRTIYAVIMSGDESITINNPVICARIVKPDKTFVYTPATVTSEAGEPTEIRFNIPGAASQISGIGRYDIRIQENGESNIVYTAEGRFVIDDDMITEEMLESVAEVNGLIFPDDFYTRDDNVAIIDDNVISTDKTWSSSKIEAEILSPDYTEIATGNPIELTNAANAPVVSLKTEIQGSQDLHGYDKPWVGGAGKNKCPELSYPLPSSGTVIVDYGKNITLSNFTLSFKFSGSFSSIAGAFVDFQENDGTHHYVTMGYVGASANTTYDKQFFSYSYLSQGITFRKIIFVNYAGFTDGKFEEIQVEDSSTPTTYSPYSNICPITAVSTGYIEVSDGDTITTHTTAFSPAIYKGSEDVANSTISIEWDMIASYSGETLPGEWISDRDEYVPGTTPTTGAQVAYELDAPISASVLPTNLPIRTHSGYTRIDSSTGEMEVEYIKSSAQSLVDLIEAVTR